MPIQDILKGDNLKDKRSLFSFDLSTDDNERILLKYNLWTRYFFPQYYKSDDADFHEDINRGNLDVYRGDIDAFVDAAFRGAGKDMKTKLFIAFAILNDMNHFRRFFRVLSEDGDNSKQSVTDVYNMLVNLKIMEMYPETFEKTDAKREKTMGSFTTSTGIKMASDTVGVDQRGANQEEARPDFIWYNDFETRKTLRSRRETHSIWENMEEARTGLEKGGGCIYTCNYISEQGNVHKLIKEKLSPRKRILIIPIMRPDPKTKIMQLTWPERYKMSDIDQMKIDDDDFEGERMCSPSASKDIYFDRESLEKMDVIAPLRDVAGFKIFREYKAHHRYGSGHDVAGGVGLDSSSSVFIDFDTIPAQVVATFHSNIIGPESFGDEIYSEGLKFGLCIQAVENNKFDQAVLKAKLLGANLYKTRSGKEVKVGHKPPAMYGWATNGLTKSKMLEAMRSAIEDGLIELNDLDLIEEFKSYTRNDLIENENDPRLVTKHFDLLIAACIAWQMKNEARAKSRAPGDPAPRAISTAPKRNPAL